MMRVKRLPTGLNIMSIMLQDWHDLGRLRTLAGNSIFTLDSNPTEHRTTLLLLHGYPTSSWPGRGH